MASVQPAPPLPTRTSFQRMLELEKKYKLERLQSSPLTSTASSPTSEAPNQHHRGPLHLVRSADSLSHYQNDLMLKAVRRNAALPSLSITIPPPSADGKLRGEAVRETESELPAGDSAAEPEPLQKSVKFLAPDSESEDDSDQSSICQSPSWEGYGQKKMEKKKEAERRRKEREKAEREARAAKKRVSSRLSKAPPVSMRPLPRVMERSNSAPSLAARSPPQTARVHQLPAVRDETEWSEQHSAQFRPGSPHNSDITGLASDSFLGGHRLELERAEAREAAANRDALATAQTSGSFRDMHSHGSARDPRHHPFYNPNALGEDTSHTALSSSAEKHDSRQSQDSRPPSASRTPQLRHMSGERHLGRNQSTQNVARNQRLREALSNQTPSMPPAAASSQKQLQRSDRGRPGDGYVRHQRDQSTERALAGLMDDQLVSTASISGQTSTRSSFQHTRHSSFSYDGRSATFTSASQPACSDRGEHSTESGREPIDYFSLPDRQVSLTSRADQDAHSSRSSQSATTKSTKGGDSHDTPPTAPEIDTSSGGQPGSAATKSATSPGSGKIRGIKGVMAGFHRQPSQGTPGAVKVPPYFTVRAKMASYGTPTVQTATIPATADVPRPPKPVHGEYGNPATQNPHSEFRISEGSSSSSNYDDVSPLPSPTTTPDTSRPQSTKGTPTMAPVDAPKAKTGRSAALGQDDDKTLGRLSEGDSDRSVSDNITPRPDGPDGNDHMNAEDRWSRTAMPLNIDFETQSVFSNNDDDEARPKEITPTQKLDGEATKHEKTLEFAEPGASFGVQRTAHAGSAAASAGPDNLGTSAGARNLSAGRNGTPCIPERSRSRDLQEDEQPKDSSSIGENDRLLSKEKVATTNKGKEKDHRALRKERKLRQKKETGEKKPDGESEDGVEAVVNPVRSASSLSTASPTLLSARFMSPIGGFVPSYGFGSNPFFVDFSEIGKAASTETAKVSLPLNVTATAKITVHGPAPARSKSPRAASPSARLGARKVRSLPSPEPQQQPPPQQQKPASAKSPASVSSSSASASSSPSLGPQRKAVSPSPAPKSTSTPVSILKPSSPPQPVVGPSLGDPAADSKPHMLSAIPKHMQQQQQQQPQQAAVRVAASHPEVRMAPIAKMFVECCSCRYYHDMPSKLYECMARPDAVVEDRALGISGAITTMVKCPWCQHNMSTSCCAGYAAVVYVKEKLH
ncbi:hypothetical protein VTK73DRAFT_8426 [Phialemonium thermophilum]|uniref:Uncharacterized protein n=1 Tax=Phialemonium thermophilum TaxID=223376 RepID=A0ABR3W8J6_9PEZI